MEAAIIGQNIHKTYRSRGTAKEVLKGLNITVPRGEIYGLLGPSGCGKTTLVKCMTGLRTVDSGELIVNGRNIKHRLCDIQIGFMPQELGLHEGLSIAQTLTYFGLLYNLPVEHVRERIGFLGRLLELPASERNIKDCSGGEQRRISLAVVLLKKFRVLLLDEPTVGLDSVLRARIWQYFQDLSQTSNVTILITTHYIEEARHAGMVGFMRRGILVAEQSPEWFLQKFQRTSLEDVFLVLCERQNKNQAIEELEDIGNSQKPVVQPAIADDRPQSGKMKALLYKNTIKMSKDQLTYLLLFFGPLFQAVMIFEAIGMKVHHIPVAIFNEELGNQHCLQTTRWYHSGSTSGTCQMKYLSCNFLSYLDDNVIDQRYYKLNTDISKHKEIKAIVRFPRQFTENFMKRYTTNSTMFQDDVLDAGSILTWCDYDDLVATDVVSREIYQAYQRFTSDLASQCGMKPKTFMSPWRPPLRFPKNSEAISDTENLFVGFAVMTILINAVSQVSTSLVDERLSGIWSRNLLAGVTSAEMVFSYVLLNGLLSFVPVVTMLTVAWLYNLTINGSILTAAVLCLLCSWNGLSIGVLFSLLSTNHSVLMFLSTAIFMPMFSLSGIFWPVEGMPKILQTITYALPVAYPHLALKYVFFKGWDWTYPQVQHGALASVLSIAVTLTSSVLMLKWRMIVE